MKLIDKIAESFNIHENNTAFCINSVSYTYLELCIQISSIRALIKENISSNIKNVGLITNDDIETYASIFALWLEGKSYVPISPDTPIDRNSYILNETGSVVLIDSSLSSVYSSKFKVLFTKNLEKTTINLTPEFYSENNVAYILYTSGSTGLPKGVPITFENLNSLMTAIDLDKKHKIFSSDKCLHMFELTFDFSLVTYLYPLLNGASVYSIPKDKIKYLYIYKLIVEEKLTYLVLVPSVIHFLRPFFKEINAVAVRYCCFGAAPLEIGITNEWKNCIPNADLYNSYGPTEFTVTTSYYSFAENKVAKTRNGIVSLGKPMNGIKAIIIDENNTILSPNSEGELCLAGSQLTSGYWKNSKKNEQSFFETIYNEENTRFYKTGDLCIIDDDGYFIFIGRKDFQVKIRGYRVELAEIEFYAREKINDIDVIAIAFINTLGNTEIALFIESNKFDTSLILNHMKSKIPDYMIPSKIIFIEKFPLNSNGKIDRKQLNLIINLKHGNTTNYKQSQ